MSRQDIYICSIILALVFTRSLLGEILLISIFKDTLQSLN